MIGLRRPSVQVTDRVAVVAGDVADMLGQHIGRSGQLFS